MTNLLKYLYIRIQICQYYTTMFRVALIILSVSFLTGCNNSPDTAPAENKKDTVA